ncbi:6,7-dimethyl-8-ribityllumazine synthase [bacterium]|nr:6,7-dimethyl-8-ribityllumazine synthase [bacterium]
MNNKILIVSANYYKEISKNLELGATNTLKENGYEYEVLNGPGCFEIPYLIKKNIDKFKAFISLGCIIKGDTYHFEVIANETSRKIMDLSIEYNVPIGFGILTCYDLEQAIIRSDINKKNKGQEAALACIQLLK